MCSTQLQMTCSSDQEPVPPPCPRATSASYREGRRSGPLWIGRSELPRRKKDRKGARTAGAQITSEANAETARASAARRAAGTRGAGGGGRWCGRRRPPGHGRRGPEVPAARARKRTARWLGRESEEARAMERGGAARAGSGGQRADGGAGSQGGGAREAGVGAWSAPIRRKKKVAWEGAATRQVAGARARGALEAGCPEEEEGHLIGLDFGPVYRGAVGSAGQWSGA